MFPGVYGFTAALRPVWRRRRRKVEEFLKRRLRLLGLRTESKGPSPVPLLGCIFHQAWTKTAGRITKAREGPACLQTTRRRRRRQQLDCLAEERAEAEQKRPRCNSPADPYCLSEEEKKKKRRNLEFLPEEAESGRPPRLLGLSCPSFKSVKALNFHQSRSEEAELFPRGSAPPTSTQKTCG